MSNLIYEIHTMKHPQLPFIYYPTRTIGHRHGLLNWHENIEILRCTAGRGGILYAGQVLPLTRDEVIIINSNTPHCLYGSEEGMEYVCLIVDNSFLAANFSADQLYFEPCVRSNDILELFDAVSHTYAEFDADRVYAVADIRCSVLRLLCALCHKHLARPPRDNANTDSDHVRSALTYLRQNLTQPITLDEVARHVGMSKYHLSRQFKLYTGQTIMQALNLMRCTQARQLLREGSSVSAAAAACGFENLSYFSRTYKRYMGQPASQTACG